MVAIVSEQIRPTNELLLDRARARATRAPSVSSSASPAAATAGLPSACSATGSGWTTRCRRRTSVRSAPSPVSAAAPLSRPGSTGSSTTPASTSCAAGGRAGKCRSRSGSGGAAADRVDERLDLEAALASLPVDLRAVVLLVDADGLSYDEAADVIGVPVGTIGSRLNRARDALRAALSPRKELEMTTDPATKSSARPARARGSRPRPRVRGRARSTAGEAATPPRAGYLPSPLRSSSCSQPGPLSSCRGAQRSASAAELRTAILGRRVRLGLHDLRRLRQPRAALGRREQVALRRRLAGLVQDQRSRPAHRPGLRRAHERRDVLRRRTVRHSGRAGARPARLGRRGLGAGSWTRLGGRRPRTRRQRRREGDPVRGASTCGRCGHRRAIPARSA